MRIQHELGTQSLEHHERWKGCSSLLLQTSASFVQKSITLCDATFHSLLQGAANLAQRLGALRTFPAQEAGRPVRLLISHHMLVSQPHRQLRASLVAVKLCLSIKSVLRSIMSFHNLFHDSQELSLISSSLTSCTGCRTPARPPRGLGHDEWRRNGTTWCLQHC